MERPVGLGSVVPDDDVAVMDEDRDDDVLRVDLGPRLVARSPMGKTRSLSDGGGTPVKLSPSPLILESSGRTSKDDSNLRESCSTPVTPHRAEFPRRGLSLQMPRELFPSPAVQPSPSSKPAPLSPKLDHSQIYASPTNILPRRSRGLDFSRAATSLHHSTLAEQSSPDSSPTIGGRAMSIPNRRSGDYGGAEQTSTSLWSVMGNHTERMHISSSLGSSHPLGSDSSSSSGDDDIMDEDMDDAYITTPQVARSSTLIGPNTLSGIPWLAGSSPAANSLLSFHQRQRPRKQPRKKIRGPLGLGFSAAVAAGLSKSPPTNIIMDTAGGHSRRESISWQANQLRISGTGSEGEDNSRSTEGAEGTPSTPSRDGQRPNVIRRVVTRRGNLLPKTKNFARIRAALAEESTPVESEFIREAEVVRQVRESDMDLEPRIPPPAPGPPAATTTQSSPSMPTLDSLDDIPEDEMMSGDSGLRLSGSFKQQALKNSKGKTFWDTFSETSSIGGSTTTPPPPPFLPRGSSSGVSEDMAMDSPSLMAITAGFAIGPSLSNSDSQRSETPQPCLPSQVGPQPPSAAEITRRINNKRRRDDDFDPGSFKRRAVSPGMSLNNSPIMQSPLQRDNAPWGSRPGSNAGEKTTDNNKGSSGTASESGSLGGTPGTAASGSQGRPNGGKFRVGFQGMVDTSDGLMRMSIE